MSDWDDGPFCRVCWREITDDCAGCAGCAKEEVEQKMRAKVLAAKEACDKAKKNCTKRDWLDGFETAYNLWLKNVGHDE